jgi:hypothetical protein
MLLNWTGDTPAVRSVLIDSALGPGGAAQYFPPVLKATTRTDPPQTIISLLVQTAACDSRSAGALVGLVAVQLSVLG